MKKVLFSIFLSLIFLAIETKAQTAVTATSTAIVTTSATTVLDTVLVKPYLGKYKSEMGSIKVWIENGQLLGELEGQPSAELRLTDKEDVLTIVGMDGDVTFIRGDEKKVVKVKINAQGTTIEGEKVE
jgi:membrane protein implicated in regulation of membrane protease activity